MKQRNPQLALRLDAGPEAVASRWCEGAPLAYLGGAVTLRLGTGRREAALEGGMLHLPLPPEALPRQIQDAAEAWLRAQAVRLISAALAAECRRLGRPLPEASLSFAGRAGWMRQDDRGGLRFLWRLAEQSEATIAEVVRRALAELSAPVSAPDLFAAA